MPPENTLSALNASPHILYAAIYTADGHLFAGYWRDDSGKQLCRLPALPDGQTQAHWFVDRTDGASPVDQSFKANRLALYTFGPTCKPSTIA